MPSSLGGCAARRGRWGHTRRTGSSPAPPRPPRRFRRRRDLSADERALGEVEFGLDPLEGARQFIAPAESGRAASPWPGEDEFERFRHVLSPNPGHWARSAPGRLSAELLLVSPGISRETGRRAGSRAWPRGNTRPPWVSTWHQPRVVFGRCPRDRHSRLRSRPRRARRRCRSPSTPAAPIRYKEIRRA